MLEVQMLQRGSKAENVPPQLSPEPDYSSILIWVSSELLLLGFAVPTVVLIIRGLICADANRFKNIFTRTYR